MLHVPHDLLGREVDLGEITVTADMIAEYMRAVGDPAMSGAPPRDAPPTFCLAVRRGASVSVPLPADMFSVHGGHDLEFHEPIRAGARYAIRGCVADVFEKMGRTGRLTVVVSEVRITDAQGALVARLVERMMVRPRPPAGARAPEIGPGSEPLQAGGDDVPLAPTAAHQAGTRGDVDLGFELGPHRRGTPDAEAIAAYARSVETEESLFRNPTWARALGYRDVLVPGPMLSAFLEHFVRQELPGWSLERLSVTFRVPTITGDGIVLSGVVTEHHAAADAERLVCDLVVEHAAGERAVTGTATLRR
jgi:acyl dehydratase